jgi:hypothetical protein
VSLNPAEGMNVRLLCVRNQEESEKTWHACVFMTVYNLRIYTSKRGCLGMSWAVAPLIFSKNSDGVRGREFYSTSLSEPFRILSSDTGVEVKW